MSVLDGIQIILIGCVLVNQHISDKLINTQKRYIEGLERSNKYLDNKNRELLHKLYGGRK